MRSPTIRPNRERAWLTVLALFSLVFFLRLWLVREWGSPLPFWDQWDAEALQLYRPWLDGSFRWADLFRAHNEHRLVLTRLIDLGLLVGTGRWQTWWQLVINAALNAATAAFLVATFWSGLTTQVRALFVGIVVALFATPSGWQNALWGLQSHAYLVNGLSCLAIVGLLTADLFRVRWWIGWGAALLVLFAQGSGVFAAIAVVAVATFTALISPAPRLHRWLSIGAIAAVVGAGLALRVEVPGHAYLQAQNLDQFLAVFFRCLAWPHISQPLLCLALQAPLLWLGFDLLRRRRPPAPLEAIALALGLVSLLNAAAIAHSRAAGLSDYLPLSRYQDSLILGTVGNLFLLLGPLSRLRNHRLISIGWLGLLLLGVSVLAAGSLTLNLPFKALQNRTSQRMIIAYLHTRDPQVFVQANLYLRPLPTGESVIAVLNDPVLAPILPPELRGETGPRPWLIRYAPWLVAASGLALATCLLRRTSPTAAVDVIGDKPA